MKKLFITLALCVCGSLLAADFPVDYKLLKRKWCYGRIRVVRSGVADFNVRVVPESWPADLRVCLVDRPENADRPGRWYIVRGDSWSSWTVRFVDSGADFSIQFVRPGWEG
ncbi:MAG: hypothetical protein K6B46_03055, partial [Opitutales bacterium]|nr:hypothetical protein [Opitutales bacterium]